MREGKSMAKVLKEMSAKGYKVPLANNMSSRLIKQTIKFREAQTLLDFLGYDFKLVKKEVEKADCI